MIPAGNLKSEPGNGIDPDLIREHFEGSPNLFRQVCEAFLEDAPRSLRRIRECWERGDLKDMALAAHSLKGSSSLFGAHELKDAALDVQVTAEARNTSALSRLLPRLEREVETVMAALKRFRKSMPEA